MNLNAVQTTIKSILDAMPEFNGVTSSILIEDGQIVTALETALKDTGVAVFIDQPATAEHSDGFFGAADVDYLINMHIRTNPKVRQTLAPTVPKFNPLTLEEAVINAILAHDSPTGSTVFNLRFSGSRFLWEDTGNNSRLLTFFFKKVYSG